MDAFGLPEEIFNGFDIKFNTNGEKELVFKSTFEIVKYQPSPEDLSWCSWNI